MARNWTIEQKQAIEANGGNILVSAAAGSGKTAVLVERVIKKMTDRKNPVSADRFLIVTFTRAAAGEMRQRISAALESEIAKNPSDKHLINQQLLLPSAKICTIDSFCNSLVKENFSLLDISPDFKTADSGELDLLSQQALELTMEEMYSKGDIDFRNLVELLFKGRDDRNISEMILDLYNNSISYSHPEDRLDEIEELYTKRTSVCESDFGKVILDEITEAMLCCRNNIMMMYSIIDGCDELTRLFVDSIELYASQIEYILKMLAENNWDGAKSAIEHFDKGKRKPARGDITNDPDFKLLVSLYENIKDIITKKIKGLMCTTADEFIDDMEYLAPMIKQLISAVKLYAKNFSELKQEKQLADFNDITHFALDLLTEKDETGNIRFTALAKEISMQFDEILIDEYQDTNRAQDLLFTSISRNNLFRVGDVKQSIYRFRRAMPEIFIALKNQYRLYSEESPEFPAKIVLKNNFRSRKSVTETINFIFSQNMSRPTGDVDYNFEEKLVCSADYCEKERDFSELHLIDISDLDRDVDSSDSCQANYIAKRINQLIMEGFTVKDGDGERKATYKDFCILLRGLNGGRGAVYADALKKNNIPCFAEIDADFFSANEISLILNLLRILDNPKQDIPLLSVMMSVLFGFSADDVSTLRINKRDGDIYSCLISLANQGNTKFKSFVDKISEWRSLGVCMSVSDFIRMIYEETAIVAIVSAMKGSQAKIANLNLLLNYAETYEKSGYIGLSGFIRFIDRLERTDNDLKGSAGVSSNADVVRIMTIHKSKGLEFPICIVANCSGKFNKRDTTKNLIISSGLGAGIIKRDLDTLAQYKTVCHNAVKANISHSATSEEMRLLYVAMTRAREKLILVGAVKNPDTNFQKKYLSRINPATDKIEPYIAREAGCYTDWIVPALLRHKNAEKLRDLCDARDNIVLDTDFDLEVFVSSWSAEDEAQTEEKEKAAPDENLLNLIEERLSWKYKYDALSGLVSKRSASEVDKGFIDREYFASSRPSFMNDDGLSAAQKGTATHSFMQYADYEKAKDNVESEIDRLCEYGIITQAEAKSINKAAIKRFFESDLAKRMLSSELILREKKFTIEIPVNELYDGMDDFSDEKVMIQGIADCAFLENGKLVVVDYKTDNLTDEDDFRRKYAEQVRLYKKALSICTDYEVSETLLYSFRLSKAISVDA